MQEDQGGFASELMFNVDSRQTRNLSLMTLGIESTLFDTLNCETLSKPIVEQLVLLMWGKLSFDAELTTWLC